jgi:hypothetical protein
MRPFVCLLGLSVVVRSCPTLKCSTSLSYGVCAVYETDSSYQVSSSRCESGSYCTVEDFEHWRDYAYLDPTLLCTTDTENVVDFEAQNGVNCSSRDQNKDLASGSSPKQCEQSDSYSSECETEDGDSGYCECGYDGKAYCRPDFSSDSYDDYWDECQDNGGKLDSSKHAAFWYLKYTYYVKYISAYSCAHNLFYEFVQLDEYDYIGDSALLLTLVYWGVGLL